MMYNISIGMFIGIFSCVFTKHEKFSFRKRLIFNIFKLFKLLPSKSSDINLYKRNSCKSRHVDVRGNSSRKLDVEVWQILEKTDSYPVILFQINDCYILL